MFRLPILGLSTFEEIGANPEKGCSVTPEAAEKVRCSDPVSSDHRSSAAYVYWGLETSSYVQEFVSVTRQNTSP